LLDSGFNFRFYTHSNASAANEGTRWCYDYGYLVKHEDTVELVVKE
jgi:hypothetical protein